MPGPILLASNDEVLPRLPIPLAQPHRELQAGLCRPGVWTSPCPYHVATHKCPSIWTRSLLIEMMKFTHNGLPPNQGSVNSFYKGANSKYFRLCRPYKFLASCWSSKQPQTVSNPMVMAVFQCNSTYKNRLQARFGPQGCSLLTPSIFDLNLEADWPQRDHLLEIMQVWYLDYN